MTIDLTGPVATFILSVIYIYVFILIVIAMSVMLEDFGFKETFLSPFIAIGKCIWGYGITYIPYKIAQKKATRLLGYKPSRGYDYYLLTGLHDIRIGALKVSFTILKMKTWTVREEDNEQYEMRLRASKGIRTSKS